MVPLLSLALLLLVQEPGAGSAEPAGLIVDEPGAAPGYVLFAPLRSRTTFVIDRKGEVLHTWDNPLSPLSVYLLDDGTLLRCGRVPDNPIFNRGGRSGCIQRLGKDGSILWEYELCDENSSLHHDIEPLPNGNVLAIAWERLGPEEALALGRDPARVSPSGWWPDQVLEIQPTPPQGGKIVWEWHAKDHLIQDFDPAKPNHGSPAERPERIDVNAEHRDAPALTEEERRLEEERLQQMRDLGYAGDEPDDGPPEPGRPRPHRSDDWLHLNSVDHDPVNDLVMLSSPELNEIWIIDHSTTTAEARGSTGGRWEKGGDLLYRWGNPRNYGKGARADQQLFFQHQAEWVPAGMPGAGNVTVFNNGMKRPGKEYSSIDELVLPFDPAQGFVRAPDEAFGPARPAWSYSDPEDFYSFFISGCHRLPNGNTFVCSGKQGRFFEVTPDKKIVWEYWNAHGGELERVFSTGGKELTKPTSVFRATKLAPDHPGLRALGITQ